MLTDVLYMLMCIQHCRLYRTPYVSDVEKVYCLFIYLSLDVFSLHAKHTSIYLSILLICVSILSIQVYGMFLETLCRFIEEHREYLDDWLFLLLLRLLHKQGTDMLKSVQFKLQLVLEHVR